MTIRRVPEDFRVEERLRPDVARALDSSAPAAAGAHAVFRLEKRSLTTPEAVARLGKCLGVRAGRIDYCGLKDKHAVTIQHASVPVAELSSTAPPPSQLEDAGIKATFAGYLPYSLRAEHIGVNSFSIVVRDVARPACEEMGRNLEALRIPDAGAAIINYFGDQRFGSARHGEGFAARHLIRGEFDAALRLLIGTPHRKDSGVRHAFTRLCAGHWGDWNLLARDLPRCPQRRAIETLASGGPPRDAFASLPHGEQVLCVEAYQSHLWNEVARIMAAALDAPRSIRAADPFGEMIFPPADVLPGAWVDLEIPSLGPEAALVDPWRGAAERVLEAEGVSLPDLRIPGLRRPAFGAAPRALVARATDVALDEARPDEITGRGRLKRELTFDLPRGSYATVLLRALGQ